MDGKEETSRRSAGSRPQMNFYLEEGVCLEGCLEGCHAENA